MAAAALPLDLQYRAFHMKHHYVVSKNKTQNVIRTASGNEFILDDKSKETQIILKTSDKF